MQNYLVRGRFSIKDLMGQVSFFYKKGVDSSGDIAVYDPVIKFSFYNKSEKPISYMRKFRVILAFYRHTLCCVFDVFCISKIIFPYIPHLKQAQKASTSDIYAYSCRLIFIKYILVFESV